MLSTLKKWAAGLKYHLYALYLASRSNRVPVYAKWLALLLVAYALSPVDLIPDFIPVIGYLDDLILLPAGIWLLIKLIPTHVWQDCLEQAKNRQPLPANKTAAAIIICIWIVLCSVLLVWLLQAYAN